MTEQMNELDIFIDRLEIKLDYARKIYLEYLKDSKKFLYAKILYSLNQDVIVLLNDNSFLLPRENWEDAIELTYHLDVWSALWNTENMTKKPDLQDTFEFANDVNFPRDSVERILSLRQFKRA